MHDILEGVLQYETKLVLIHIIQDCHYLTLKHLNHLIAYDNLGCMEVSSRPSEISLSDDKLKQNGKFHILVCSYMYMYQRWMQDLLKGGSVILLRTKCVQNFGGHAHFWLFDRCERNCLPYQSNQPIFDWIFC